MLKPVHAAVGTSSSATPETAGGILSRAANGVRDIFRSRQPGVDKPARLPSSTPSRAEPPHLRPGFGHERVCMEPFPPACLPVRVFRFCRPRFRIPPVRIFP